MRRLVIFSIDTFGDIALRQSFFKGLLDLGYEVTVVVQAHFAVLLPFLDSRLQWVPTRLNPKQLSLADQSEVEALRAEIAKCKPDALVSPEYFYTDLEQWLMLLFPALPRFGFDNPRLKGTFKISQPWVYWKLKGRWGAFNHWVTGCKEGDHEFSKTQAMFKAITGQELTALPQIVLSKEVVNQNANVLQEMNFLPRRYVLAALGGNTNASIKLLPAETCAKTLIYIQEKYKLPAVITGVKSEATHLQKIAALCADAGVTVTIWLGTAETFATLLYLIQNSRFYYGNDTGAMHFAGAMNIPVVAHFGGGGGYKFLPLAEKSYVVCQDLPCYGCGWNCWAGTPLCITRVPVEKLLQAVDWIMDPSTSGKKLDQGEKLTETEFQFIQKKSRWYQRKRMLKLGLQALRRNFL